MPIENSYRRVARFWCFVRVCERNKTNSGSLGHGLGSDCYVHEEVNYLTIQFYIDLLAHSRSPRSILPLYNEALFLSV